MTLFTILMALLESGYVLYRDQHTSARSTQWQGWHDYMVMWAQRADFRKAWSVSGIQFDSEFAQHMEAIIRDVNPPAAPVTNPEQRQKSMGQQ